MVRGRCPSCESVRDAAAVSRSERRAAFLDSIGGGWYWWLGEAVGVLVIALVIAGVLPIWALVIAGILLFRALSRLAMTAAREGLDV